MKKATICFISLFLLAFIFLVAFICWTTIPIEKVENPAEITTVATELTTSTELSTFTTELSTLTSTSTEISTLTESSTLTSTSTEASTETATAATTTTTNTTVAATTITQITSTSTSAITTETTELTTGTTLKANKTLIGDSFQATYYLPNEYQTPGNTKGGSGRVLRSCNASGDEYGIKGSVACRSAYEVYGYDRNGQTILYIEFPSGYEEMTGYYYLDDCCAGYGIVDFYFDYIDQCPFQYVGRLFNLTIYVSD